MRQNSSFVISAKSKSNIKRGEKVTFILLAENYGYRMKSYGPLSLIDINNGMNLLEHQIHAISSSFVDYEIILCSGFETNKVYHFIQNNFPSSLPIRIVENQVYYHSNCCEGLRLCMNNTMNDKIIVCGGGVLLTTDYLKNLNIRKSSIMYQEGGKMQNFEVGIISNGANRLESLSLAVKDKVWTELLYLTGPALVKSFYNMVSKPELKNKFLFEAINVWRGRKALNLEHNSNKIITKIDNIKTLKRIKEQ